METASGVITIVQEDRFQLAGEDGRKRLFTLSRHAPLRIDELQALAGARHRVRVRYRAVEGELAGEARQVERV
ncbi:MAG: hypothetical protein JO010_13990 [Alphaproteobacteria bacterium]|nr:hypothetical protein [Alphaproteobacteria bacterium]